MPYLPRNKTRFGQRYDLGNGRYGYNLGALIVILWMAIMFCSAMAFYCMIRGQ